MTRPRVNRCPDRIADTPCRTGAAVQPEAVPLHLRRASVTRVSMEANAGICRGMLRHRYGTEGQGESPAGGEEDR